MYKVLIIDDDKLARKGVISMVPWEKCNLTVVGDVANGMQALEYLENHPVDLAIVDLSMPVISGMDFIRESSQKYPGLKFVILTFHEDFENVQNAIRYGVLDYISKLRLEEMDCEEVFQRIGRLMSHETTEESGVNGMGRTGSGLPDTRELSYEQLEEMRTVWCSLKWIYSNREFKRQIEKLSRSRISERQLERIMMWVEQELESRFGYASPVPYLIDKQEGFTWLHECREGLYSYVKKLNEYQIMNVCILKAVIYIRENIGQGLTSENVAQSINMSRSYFSTSFKLVTGETFNDFIKEERISMAKQILESGFVRTEDLAVMVGYEDSKYFAKLFQAETGMNCSEYAKQFSARQN